MKEMRHKELYDISKVIQHLSGSAKTLWLYMKCYENKLQNYYKYLLESLSSFFIEAQTVTVEDKKPSPRKSKRSKTPEFGTEIRLADKDSKVSY